MTDKQWMPDLGQECEYLDHNIKDYAWCMYHGKTADGYSHIIETEHTVFTDADTEFRPTQTEADKQRDKQIERINNQLSIYGFEPVYSETGEQLYKQGVRVIAPDEYVVKRLTGEQKERLSRVFGIGEADAVRVQIELGITP